jgi:hypothetical protein
MRLWNLSKYPELETCVLQSYGSISEGKRRVQHVQVRNAPSRFKVALSIAALTASFSIGVVQTNASTVNLPLSAVSVAQSVPESRPPLAGFFQRRLNDDWSEGLENSLLMKVESRRLQGAPTSLVDQTVDVVFSNQLEDLSDIKSKKLSREQITALVKSRKLKR